MYNRKIKGGKTRYVSSIKFVVLVRKKEHTNIQIDAKFRNLNRTSKRTDMEIWNFRSPRYKCEWCGAIFWYEERAT